MRLHLRTRFGSALGSRLVRAGAPGRASTAFRLETKGARDLGTIHFVRKEGAMDISLRIVSINERLGKDVKVVNMVVVGQCLLHQHHGIIVAHGRNSRSVRD